MVPCSLEQWRIKGTAAVCEPQRAHSHGHLIPTSKICAWPVDLPLSSLKFGGQLGRYSVGPVYDARVCSVWGSRGNRLTSARAVDNHF